MRISRWGRATLVAIGVVLSAALAPGSASAAVTGISPVIVTATATQQFSGTVATFQADDSGPFDISIDWGDGSTPTVATISPAKSSSYDVPGTHTYGHEGTYKVTVQVSDSTDKGATKMSTVSTAQVADAPLTAQGTSISATAGLQFGGTVATFTDPDTSGGAMAYSATIDWGDGTSSSGTVVTNQSGGFSVQGAHTWACCAAGSFTVKVTINDSGGASASVTDAATVAAGTSPPPAAPPFLVTTTAPITGQKVTFDATPLDYVHGGAIDHRWDLNGDGILERDTHHDPAVQISYGKPGTYAISLLITYRDGVSTTFRSTEAVSGPVTSSCGVYCATSAPFHSISASSTGGGANCQHTLHFGVVDAVGDCLRPTGGGAYEADGALRVNGLDFYPDDPGAHVVLNSATNTISSNGANVTLQAGELGLGDEPIAWSGLDGGGTNRAVLPNVLGSGSMEGFPFVGTTSLTMTYVLDSSPGGPGNHGITTIGGYIMLPDFLGGVSVSIGLGINNTDGLTLDQLHVSLDNARLKFLPIKMLSIDYDQSGGRWGGGLEIPTGSISVGATIGLRPVDPSLPNGDLTLDHLSAIIDDLNQQIADGIFLQSISAGFALAPPVDVFMGGIGLSEGPKIHDIDLIDLMGTFTVTTGNPLEFNLSAELDVLTFKIATATVDYRTDGHLSFNAHVRVPYWSDPSPPPPVYIRADVDGFVDGATQTWLAEGRASACLGVCLDVDALASNIAVAGCIGFGFGDVGGDYTFSDQTLHLFGSFGGSCDLSPFRPTTSSVRAADGTRTLTLPRGTRLAAFEVVGQGAPPLVQFTGPHGLSVSTPTSAPGLKNAHFWLIRNAADHTTYLAVTGSNIGGTWKITPQAGSAPVTAATYALARPPIKVTAKVGGHARRRLLRYSVRPQPGQRVVFSERGPHAADRVLGTARGARGTIRFTPTDGPAGRRQIVATVMENNLPRKALTVASYLAPSPLRPARPTRLVLTRAGTTLNASWRAAKGASSYEVTFTTINHRKQVLELPASKRRVTFTIVRPVDPASVSVTGLDGLMRPGPAVSATLKAGQQSYPAAKKKRRKPAKRRK